MPNGAFAGVLVFALAQNQQVHPMFLETLGVGSPSGSAIITHAIVRTCLREKQIAAI